MSEKISFISKYGSSKMLEPYVGKYNQIVHSPNITKEQLERHVRTAPMNNEFKYSVLPKVLHPDNDILTDNAFTTLFDRLATSGDPDDLLHSLRLAIHPKSPSSLLTRMFHSDDPKSKAVAIVHSIHKLPPDEVIPHLNRLADDDSDMVRKYVARDNRTPIETLQKLEKDRNSTISSFATRTLKGSNK